jgi:hypothetical protein
MQKTLILFITAVLLLPGAGQAAKIEGVPLPETIQLEGKTLHLNGAGIRTKFFFDIYVSGLYLEQPSSSATEIIGSNSTKRLTMDILYDEVSREKLTDGWEHGFKKNQSKKMMAALRRRLDSFNALFVTARKGDSMIFDFLSDGTTRIKFNGYDKGSIDGADFQQALLAVWLGKNPADQDLKDSLLGK